MQVSPWRELWGWQQEIWHLEKIGLQNETDSLKEDFLAWDYWYKIPKEYFTPPTWPPFLCLLLQHGRRDVMWTHSISVLLQIIFCSCVIETTLLFENDGLVPRADREWLDIFSWSKERWSNGKKIIELGYRKISWFVSVSQINYLPQPSASAFIIDLLATEKSRYFAQPRWIIVNYVNQWYGDLSNE